MARAVDFAVPLPSYTLLPLLDQCLSPHSPYLTFVTRRQPVPHGGITFDLYSIIAHFWLNS